jgi:hypothetical protein
LPNGKFGGGYKDCKIPFFTNFAQKNQKIFLVRADSHSPKSLSTVKSILKKQKIAKVCCPKAGIGVLYI